MNEETIKLLKECSSGCKMALNSIEQILEHTEDEMLEHVIKESKQDHEKIEKEVGDLLRKYHKEEKEPEMMAAVFSKISTDVKIMMNGGNTQIAKILMDGCNMGIQSISEARNKYQDADKEALDLAATLIRKEEEFMKKLRVYL